MNYEDGVAKRQVRAFSGSRLGKGSRLNKVQGSTVQGWLNDPSFNGGPGTVNLEPGTFTK
jgi:hypothetical protein